MEPEFSKREKQIARDLMDRGIQEDIKKGLMEFDDILQQWKNEAGHNGDCFYTLHDAVRNFKKEIAWKYDYRPGSRYMSIIIYQLSHELYQPSELDGFRPEIKEYILSKVKKRREDNVV